MTAQAKKDTIISELVETRRKILDAASSLSPEEQDEIFLGIWSVKDLLAHLVGWDYANTEAAKQVLAGKLPGFYAYYDRDWKSYNARLVAQYRRDRFTELLSLVEDSHQRLIDLLETIPAEEFHKDRGVRFKGYKVTIARLLQAEIDDEKTHHTQVKEFGEGKRP
jgi:uncharacterized damage-inducible protein DinB